MDIIAYLIELNDMYRGTVTPGEWRAGNSERKSRNFCANYILYIYTHKNTHNVADVLI